MMRFDWPLVSVPAHARKLGISSLRLGAIALTAGLLLSACQDSEGLRSGRAWKPVPAEMISLMEQKGSTKSAPILLRAFKKEAELEVWKMRADGTYAHLKTYPMCRWSGQLGPKVREGDRQVPEGFYTITPGQMNPNSQYYLAFNVGYPNAYDKAHGFTGGAIMVHGACSSAGCFSMTDEQIGEIYAIARDAFAGGQRAIQMQSMPFRMNPENLARHRLDPNMKFWREIKEGVDQFEVTKREPQVAFCGRRYVFNASPADGSRLDANAACPPLREDSELKALVAEKRQAENARIAELSTSLQPIKLQYSDGGQHPSFAHVMMVSRPEALAQAPVEIELQDKTKPVPAAVKMAARATPGAIRQPGASATPATQAVVAGPAPVPSSVPAAMSAFSPAEPASTSAPFYKRWLGLSGDDAPVAAATPTPPAPAPGNARKTPAASNVKVVDPRQRTSALPDMIRGAQPVLPAGLMAFARNDR